MSQQLRETNDFGVERLGGVHDVAERTGDHLAAASPQEYSVRARVKALHRRGAENRGAQTIEKARCAASLYVAKLADAQLESEPLGVLGEVLSQYVRVMACPSAMTTMAWLLPR